MSIYYIRDCGHSTLKDPWKNGPDIRLDGLCMECRAARIGQEIRFVRHGTPPVGASRNHRDGTHEEGVSVYEIVNGKPNYIGWYFEISKRPAYSGRGVIVGWGSDGEPLVEVISIRRDKKFDSI